MNRIMLFLMGFLFAFLHLVGQEEREMQHIPPALSSHALCDSLADSEKEVFKQWDLLQRLYGQRMVVVPKLLAMYEKYSEDKSVADDLLRRISAASTRARERSAQVGNLTDEQKVWSSRTAQNELSFMISTLAAGLLERHPELESDKPFLALVDNIIDLDAIVQDVSTDYNRRVRWYNTLYFLINKDVPMKELGIMPKAYLPAGVHAK